MFPTKWRGAVFLLCAPDAYATSFADARGADVLATRASQPVSGIPATTPGSLKRLRSRSLGAKRALVRRVHECVFGVLALESEPVDSRL